MKIKQALVFAGLVLCFQGNAQEVITDLYGFRLGQFREAAAGELGKPLQKEKFPDGYEYEVFLVKPDTSVYMFFEFAAGQTDIIWSIQISGVDNSIDIGFKNLRLGDGKSVVEKICGPPQKIQDAGKYGVRWEYDKSNYSFEINPNGKLSSIKIKNTYVNDAPDASKLPAFDQVVTELTAQTNAELAAVLSPGIEINYDNKTFLFGRSLRSEIIADHSRVFEVMRNISQGLKKINTNDPDTYEENVRAVYGVGIRHVIKVKKGHIIKEIVMQYENGKYVIWEIKT